MKGAVLIKFIIIISDDGMKSGIESNDTSVVILVW